MPKHHRNFARAVACALGLLGATQIAHSEAKEPKAAEAGNATRTEDVVYGRKPGLALTMDVFRPERANGIGVVMVVSGGWYSGHQAIRPEFFQPLLDRGYTVFAVVHGSQPKYAIPEILNDMHRAVRFIRHHAKEYGVDPDRIGITGGSAGGHLSLMQGTAGTAGNAKAEDPVERESSRVQAVACFFPPTDFLNYGKPGENSIGRGILKNFRGAFDFEQFDETTHRFVEIEDEAKILEIGKQISPVTHVSADDPPTLIAHGDADELVPIQQAETILEKLEAAGVETKLITKPGAAHGWADMAADVNQFADWFDVHLLKDGKPDKPANDNATDSKFEIPATDDGLPGAGPIRRTDWFRSVWKERRMHFAERAEQDKGALTFFGDSITQGWSDDFRAHFPKVKKANRGISGDTTRGMLVRLDEDVLALDPSGVVMLMGTNDLGEQATPEVVAGNVKLIVEKLHAHDADMPVVLCLVMPSSASKNRPAEKIRKLNQLLTDAMKAFPQVTVLDTWTLFANEQGDAKPEVFPDLLHPNDAGYAKWAEALEPILASLKFSPDRTSAAP